MAGAVSAPAAESDEARFGELLNAERSSRLIARVSADAALLEVARTHSAEMADSGRLFHSPSLGSQVSGWVQLGENIGRGPTADVIHRTLMASASHRAQILDVHYQGFAVGSITRDGEIWVTELFILRSAEVLGGPAAPSEEPLTAQPEPVFVRTIERLAALDIPRILDVRIERRESALPLAALAFLLLVIDAHLFKLTAPRRSKTHSPGLTEARTALIL